MKNLYGFTQQALRIKSIFPVEKINKEKNITNFLLTTNTLSSEILLIIY